MSEAATPLLLAAGAVLYAIGSLRLARRSTQAPRLWQLACGFSGLAVLIVLDLPLFHELGHDLFTVHMAAHIALAAVAAPLLVLAQPIVPLLWSLPHGPRLAIGTALGRLGRWRIRQALTSPLLAGTLHAVAIWAWHVPAFYEAALARDSVHLLQHASFLLTGLAFWGAVFSTGQAGAAILLLFVTLTHTGILGALLAFSSFPWYHGHTPEPWGLSTLEDQQLAGLVMWVPASFIYLAAAVWAGARLLREPAAPLGEQRS